MIYLLTIVFFIVVGALLVSAVWQFGASKLDNRVKTLTTDLAHERRLRVESDRALDKAERTFRSIANGAGNPVLEAQIALDEISAYHEKELN